MLLSVCILSQQARGADHSEKLWLDGPMIVGFFPWVDENTIDADDGTREGVAHLGFALEDLAKCLKGRGIKIQLILTDRLIFEERGRAAEFQIADRVGCYFVSPGKPPCIVYAKPGPSSLTIIAPAAAAKYFNAPECLSNDFFFAPDQDFCESDR
jgi:hypothetical protein